MESNLPLVFAIVFFLLLTLAAVRSGEASSFKPKAGEVIVCLGDSITDGNTYPQIIMQALREAGKPVPAMVCAGVVCDTAPLMAARVRKTVLAFQPALVTMAAGTNDALRGESAAVYEQAVRKVAEEVRAAGAKMILLTPCIIDVADAAKREAGEKLVAEYADAIRRVARDYGFAVAENNALQREARQAGRKVMSDDGIHPNYFGQSLMARAILDAMGYADVPLPKEFTPHLFPGVIRAWRYLPVPLEANGKPIAISAANCGELLAAEGWQTLSLPDPEPTDRRSAEDWLEQERRNGFCYATKAMGKTLLLSAALPADAEQDMWINTATGVSKVFWNGREVTPAETNDEDKPCLRGYHAGKHRIPVRLQKGENTLLIEVGAGQEWFCSVTDKMIWEQDLAAHSE